MLTENKSGTATFWLRCFFRASFLNFVKCEDPYLAEGFVHNLCLYFDIIFAQLGFILTTRIKFVEITAVGERYWTTTHLKKEWKKQLLRVYLSKKIADGKISIKKEKNFRT